MWSVKNIFWNYTVDMCCLHKLCETSHNNWIYIIASRIKIWVTWLRFVRENNSYMADGKSSNHYSPIRENPEICANFTFVCFHQTCHVFFSQFVLAKILLLKLPCPLLVFEWCSDYLENDVGFEIISLGRMEAKILFNAFTIRQLSISLCFVYLYDVFVKPMQ